MAMWNVVRAASKFKQGAAKKPGSAAGSVRRSARGPKKSENDEEAEEDAGKTIQDIANKRKESEQQDSDDVSSILVSSF